MKTIASVGDKPLPIVTGEPGTGSLRAEPEDINRPAPSGSRISGRVYDERGKPAPDVKVRLAVGGAAGGKAIVATTDRSGAFTLHGLRSGSSYTVIAEYEDEEGTMSGRAQAESTQTDVRDRLQAPGGANQGHASIRPARLGSSRSRMSIRRTKSRSMKMIDDRADGSMPKISSPRRLKPPPSCRRIMQGPGASSDPSRTAGRAGWNVRQGASKAGDGSSSASRSQDDGETTDRPGSSDRSAPEIDDDGPNPLPPAIESGAARSIGRPRALVEESFLQTAQSEPDRSSEVGHQDAPTPPQPVDPRAGGIHQQPAEQAPQPIPAELLAADPAGPGTSVQKPRRPTWRDLPDKQGDVPLDESVHRATTNAPRPAPGAVSLTGANQPPKSGLARLLGKSQPLLDDAVKQSACSIDPTDAG